MNTKINKKQVADLYHSGMNMRNIGKRLGVSNSDICKFMIKHNISTRAFGYNTPRGGKKELDVQEVTNLYKSGKSVIEIAETFDVGVSTALKFMNRNGIGVKRRVRLDKEEVAALYESGYSSKRIGKMLGVSAPTILKFMKKQGINLRKDKKI